MDRIEKLIDEEMKPLPQGFKGEDFRDLGELLYRQLGDHAQKGFNLFSEEALTKWLNLARKLKSFWPPLSEVIPDIEAAVHDKQNPDDFELKDYGDYGKMRVRRQ